MHYLLALDLGTTSLGWAVYHLNKHDQPDALIKIGSRIFGDGRNPKDGSSLAVARRAARQMRRRRDRLISRKKRLLTKLEAFGFFPTDTAARKKLFDQDPYHLRAQAAVGPVTPYEFGRALIHINQRRGFKSNRKTDAKDNDSGALKTAIKRLATELESGGFKTLGHWLAERHAREEPVRARLSGTKAADKAYTFYVDRSMIEHEFDTIWAVQSQLNPALFTEEARATLREIIINQRPLKPVKPGRCSYLHEEPRAPEALPSTQRFKLLQELNHLRIVDGQFNERPLTLEERDQLLHELTRKKKMSFDAIRRKLKLASDSRFSIEDIKRKELKGDITSTILGSKKLLGDRWYALTLQLQDDLVRLLLDTESEAELIQHLTTMLDISEDEAQLLANTSLPEGYGRLSQKALDKLIPELTNGVVTYDKAVKNAGLGSHSQLGFGADTGEVLKELPYYGIPLQRYVAFASDNPTNEEQQYGKIANPTVHIALNQVRVVVNAIIKRYGLPSKINIEVARDLKLSEMRKREIARQQKQNQDRNERYIKEACETLGDGWNPDTLDRNTRRKLSQKMQLWVELNPESASDRCCPYSGQPKSKRQLLSEEVEIEHILPFSRTFDDSMANKTVAFVSENRRKSNRTPIEMLNDGILTESQYNDMLRRAAKMGSKKALRFGPNGMKRFAEENAFQARALTDTAYIARVSGEYLQCVCPKGQITFVSGKLTSLVRGHLGLNSLLSVDGVKNRDDHRHHAIDAAVIGICNKSLVQKISKASEDAEAKGLAKLLDTMPAPLEGKDRQQFRKIVESAVQAVWVSHKPNHGYQGAMHEESAWGLSDDGSAHRHIQTEDNRREKVVEKKKLILIADDKQSARHGLDEDGNPKPYKGYVGGSNYCIEVTLNEKQKWIGNVVSTYDAYTIVRQAKAEHGEELGEKTALEKLRHPNLSLDGAPLVMRLMIGDLLQIDANEGRELYRVVKMASSGSITLAPHFEGGALKARDADKEDYFKYVSKTAGSLQKANAVYCTVSPDGRLKKHAK